MPILLSSKPVNKPTGPAILIRHGLFSSAEAMRPIEKFLTGEFKHAIDNQSYDWKLGVLRNGLILAEHIVDKFPERNVVLVGHSMGGLVARVANILLTDSEAASTLNIFRTMLDRPLDEVDALIDFAEKKPALGFVKGIVTLATPNSGAMTAGQISSLTNLATVGGAVAAKAFTWGAAKAGMAVLSRGGRAFFNMRYESVTDLTSDRLFRFFQYFHVPTPCLSISGSRGNYLTGPGVGGAVTKLAGIHMQEPHDLVVENRSVDLNDSVLPHEFEAGSFRHVRQYRDCADADHFDMYTRLAVLEKVSAAIKTWLGP